MGERTSDQSLNRVVIANAVILVALLHTIRFGYDFGASDQDEFVPAALRALDTTLFKSDWLVMWQSAGFNVRTPTIMLLSALGSVLSIQGAALLLYIASFALIALAAIRLVQLVTNSRVAVFIAPVLMLVATPRFTLGGNDLTHTLLVPSMLAWALALHGVVMLLKRRHLAAGLLFGLATLFQPLVGIQTAGLSVLAVAATSPRATMLGEVRRLLSVAVVAALVASPVLLFILRTQLGGGASVPAAREFDLLVRIRAPHHFLPTAYPAESFLRFGVLAVAGLSATMLAPVLKPLRRFLIALYLVVAVACVGYVLGVVHLELLPVAKMQLMKSTVLIKVFACVAVSASVGVRLTERHKSRTGESNLFHHLGSSKGTTLALLGLLAGTVTMANFVPALGQRFGIMDRRDSSWSALHDWARSSTPIDDLFAVPPSNSDMRTFSRRAVASNFKAFAFQPEAMLEWNTRLVAFSNNPDIATHFIPGNELDASYETMETADLLAIADRYGVDHFVRRTRVTETDSASATRVRLLQTLVGSRAGVGDSLFVYTTVTE